VSLVYGQNSSAILGQDDYASYFRNARWLSSGKIHASFLFSFSWIFPDGDVAVFVNASSSRALVAVRKMFLSAVVKSPASMPVS
jgi:hypothetical protein